MDQHRDAASSLLIFPSAVQGAEREAAKPGWDRHGESPIVVVDGRVIAKVGQRQDGDIVG
jgi:hypothetical protein